MEDLIYKMTEEQELLLEAYQNGTLDEAGWKKMQEIRRNTPQFDQIIMTSDLLDKHFSQDAKAEIEKDAGQKAQIKKWLEDEEIDTLFKEITEQQNQFTGVKPMLEPQKAVETEDNNLKITHRKPIFWLMRAAAVLIFVVLGYWGFRQYEQTLPANQYIKNELSKIEGEAKKDKYGFGQSDEDKPFDFAAAAIDLEKRPNKTTEESIILAECYLKTERPEQSLTQIGNLVFEEPLTLTEKIQVAETYELRFLALLMLDRKEEAKQIFEEFRVQKDLPAESQEFLKNAEILVKQY